jgi:putative transposase
MGMQVSYSLDSEMPEESSIRPTEKGPRPLLRKLALQKESEVIEGKLKVDHVHVVVSIPPKYSVSQVVGYVKGKSAIWVASTTGRNRNFVGQNFWARGYCVSTVGLREEDIREYVRSQEEADEKLDQLKMFE